MLLIDRNEMLSSLMPVYCYRKPSFRKMAERSGGSPPVGGERRGAWSPGGRTAKVCGVCGDRAKSYHFGGISCDSCKAFFRRSVQNEAHSHFQCPYEGRCEITVSSRKCCQHCRFKKCLLIGMEKSWVMTEEERLQMLRQRMERKSKAQEPVAEPPKSVNRQQEYRPEIEHLTRYMDNNDIHLIEHVVHLHEQSSREVALSMGSHEKGDGRPSSNVDLIAMFSVNVRRYTHFARQLDAFRRLPPGDQGILLRTGMVEMCVLGGVSTELSPRLWPASSPIPPPQLWTGGATPEDISRLISPDTFAKHVRFSSSLRDLKPDEPTLVLLLVTVLFSPDRPGLMAGDVIENEQELWLTLLRRYIDWRYGRTGGGSLYAKLLLKLPDLRELNDAHAKHTLQLDEEELAQIQGRLGNLKLVELNKDSLSSLVEMVLPSPPNPYFSSPHPCLPQHPF